MTEREGGRQAFRADERQIEELVQRLTLAQKIDLVSGQYAVSDAGEVPDVPAGLPRLYLADGPAGIRLNTVFGGEGQATALPAPIALAATWDPDLARAYGDVLGAEAADTGRNVFLGPAVDIARAPRGGRIFEAFGEDPLLGARLVALEVQAIQAHHVEACLKHYIANNQEYQRNTIDVRVDERTLHEIYLPAVAAAVRAGLASVMASYNKINGVYACENRYTLTEILRQELGFQGWTMSDFMATQSTAGSANAGLDYELGLKWWGTRLSEAVQAAEVSAETIDEMVRRILRPALTLGLVDYPAEIRPEPRQFHREAARRIAERALVLLKNEGELLPLLSPGLRSIAVIGPDADNISAAGSGSAFVRSPEGAGVLDCIRRRVGRDVSVRYAPGVDPIGPGALLPGPPAVPSSVLRPPDGASGERGLLAEYWDNVNFEGQPRIVRIEPGAALIRGFFDFAGLNAASPKLPPAIAGLGVRFSARWTGTLTAPTDGDYLLALTCLGSGRLYVDDRLVIDAPWPGEASAESNRPAIPDIGAGGLARVPTASLRLAEGERYRVRVEYAAAPWNAELAHGSQVRFGWQPPAGACAPGIAEAAELARASDVAIVVARTYEGESLDRPDLRLPNEQDRLIRAVAVANPRTVVVLMNGGPVETASWEHAVPAILEAWFTGQEQGHAVAGVLFGDTNPSGKLPLTFPRDEDQTPMATPAQYPGVDGAVHYSEGLLVGYRGYDQLDIEPQYPFGYGLSYTRFAYSRLRVTPETSDGTQTITVSFEVTNVGRRPGTEVAQV